MNCFVIYLNAGLVGTKWLGNAQEASCTILSKKLTCHVRKHVLIIDDITPLAILFSLPIVSRLS